jgi:uncharacterized protein YkwD
VIFFALFTCAANRRLNRLAASSANRLGRTVLIALMPVLTLALALPQAPAMGASQAALNLQKMLDYNNAERNARGIRPLDRNSTLDGQAQRWAEKLAAEGQMYHRPSTYALSVGFFSGAENLAWRDSSLSASQAHNMWMDSSTHRRNMLDPAFHAAGFGVACSTKSGRAYAIAVVEFGGDAAPSRSTPAASPHVAGGQSTSGVGCSGSVADQAAPPPPASSTSPAAAASPPATSPTGAAPVNTQVKQAQAPSGSAMAGQPSPSTSPVAKYTTKSHAPPPAGNPQVIAGNKSETAVASPEPIQGEAGPSPGGSSAENTELASAQSETGRRDPTRLLLSALAAGAAYLFLLRAFGIRAFRTRAFGIGRTQRRGYSPRHSSH